ncbi:urease accessory protein UreD [Nocardioides baculatus]|uniref:Urease accessory protein UreD n=1 Tax=Nocardioides baculatus TaxID=2801337 RepID=A0ABS1L9I3_9ACTN|nr:urease accessory protein UreD [Nocardioides baculatus]MBL0748353.1 urease accessory protein UreD [Nocardioides baculatus]
MLLSSTTTSARVCLVPEGALLLADDEVELVVEVGPGAGLELVEPGGTVAYDMRGGTARWDVDVTLGDHARLVWGGEPFVLAAGADVRRHTRVRVGTGARLALRETLVRGRHGEPGGRMVQRLEVVDQDASPLVVEELAVDPSTARGVLGLHRVVASVLALGLDLPAEVLTEDRYDLEAGGTWWRRLGDEVHRTVAQDAWSTAREQVSR